MRVEIVLHKNSQLEVVKSFMSDDNRVPNVGEGVITDSHLRKVITVTTNYITSTITVIIQ